MMIEDPQKVLLAEVEAFLASANMAPSTFGLAAVGNDRLVFRMRAGEGMTMTTYRRVRTYMHDYQRRARGDKILRKWAVKHVK